MAGSFALGRYYPPAQEPAPPPTTETVSRDSVIASYRASLEDAVGKAASKKDGGNDVAKELEAADLKNLAELWRKRWEDHQKTVGDLKHQHGQKHGEQQKQIEGLTEQVKGLKKQVTDKDMEIAGLKSHEGQLRQDAEKAKKDLAALQESLKKTPAPPNETPRDSELYKKQNYAMVKLSGVRKNLLSLVAGDQRSVPPEQKLMKLRELSTGLDKLEKKIFEVNEKEIKQLENVEKEIDEFKTQFTARETATQSPEQLLAEVKKKVEDYEKELQGAKEVLSKLDIRKVEKAVKAKSEAESFLNALEAVKKPEQKNEIELLRRKLGLQ
jgi:chromosome segregation ATPase